MSVTYIDPPGPLSNTVEPLDFTTTELVTSISIEFSPGAGNGLRETVFDGTEADGSGGDFSYLYRNSTKPDTSGPGPYVWTIRRSGRWPADLRLRVKENIAPSGSASWGQLYSVDFTALAAQTFAAPGLHTIDGLPWWCKTGGSSLGAIATALVPGSGLLVGNSWSGNDNSTVSFSRKMFLRLTDIPGYDPSAPVAIYARPGQPGNQSAGMGVCDAAADASAFSSSERTRSTSIQRGNAAPAALGDLTVFRAGSSVENLTSTPARAADRTGLGVYVNNSKSVTFATFDSDTDPNPYSAGFDRLSNAYTSVDGSYDLSALGVYFSYYNFTSNGGGQPAYIKNLTVWQPSI